MPRALYGLYERRLARSLDPAVLPRHIGVILDGNRRWARLSGVGSAQGHRAGAQKIQEFLGWCEDLGIDVVTLYLLSTDNLGRPPAELAALVDIIGDVVDGIAATGCWRLHVVGAPDRLPGELSVRLRTAEQATVGATGLQVNAAVGYGGREEIADAVKALLRDAEDRGTTLGELARQIDVEAISAHLYTKGQPDPDLVIRTSGEQRLSGFLLWQSAHSEFYFCEALWPDFRRVDFLRALRDFSHRERRFGH